MIPRRVFLRNGAAAVGLSAVPGFLCRTLLAAAPTDRRKILVVIFQRGGADGLNTVVPFGDTAYYDHRPTIGVPAPGKGDGAAIDLDGFFGLNPALRPLLAPYKEGRLGIVNAVGTPDTGGRSHFQAQDFMESAAPGNKTVSTGWLNRYLQVAPDPARTPMRATAIGEMLPKALRGPAAALAVGQVDNFGLDAAALFETAYSREANSLLTGTAKEMFETIKQLKSVRPEQYQPAKGINYGPQNNAAGAVGRALMQIAMLIKADMGLQIAFVDTTNGWDTHADQSGRLPPLLRSLGSVVDPPPVWRPPLPPRLDEPPISSAARCVGRHRSGERPQPGQSPRAASAARADAVAPDPADFRKVAFDITSRTYIRTLLRQ